MRLFVLVSLIGKPLVAHPESCDRRFLRRMDSSVVPGKFEHFLISRMIPVADVLDAKVESITEHLEILGVVVVVGIVW
jgi:hypothetical protein